MVILFKTTIFPEKEREKKTWGQEGDVVYACSSNA